MAENKLQSVKTQSPRRQCADGSWRAEWNRTTRVVTFDQEIREREQRVAAHKKDPTVNDGRGQTGVQGGVVSARAVPWARWKCGRRSIVLPNVALCDVRMVVLQ